MILDVINVSKIQLFHFSVRLEEQDLVTLRCYLQCFKKG